MASSMYIVKSGSLYKHDYIKKNETVKVSIDPG